MPESSELLAVLESAERSAAAGDHASARRFLGEALRLQEAALGPSHPDLASTLNNLAVVCEMTNEFSEAEACYRRAYAVASAGLAAEHPSVATSRQNLQDFCEARGLPFDRPVAVRKDRPSPPQPPPAGPEPSPKRGHESPRAVHAAPPRKADPSRRLMAGAAIVLVLSVAVIAALRPWASGDESVQAPPAPPAEPIANAAAPAATRDRAPAKSRSGASASRVTLVTAQLCRSLSTGSGEWKCTPPGAAVGPGQLTFYTRVKSPIDTVVQHRWYRDGELRQAGELQVRANASAGFRTYSRHTIDAQGAGAWRVELRTNDGTVLHEERFIVR